MVNVIHENYVTKRLQLLSIESALSLMIEGMNLVVKIIFGILTLVKSDQKNDRPADDHSPKK